MSDPIWLDALGAIGGIIGAVAGIGGAIVAYVAIRRTNELKVLDLRLELRRMESTLSAEIDNLIPLLEEAKASRTRLAAAQGAYGSGATKQWVSLWETDMQEAKALLDGASALDVDITMLSRAELEARLIRVHKLQNGVSRLTTKYRGSIAEDDKGRDELQANHRMITQARLEGRGNVSNPRDKDR